MMNRSIKSPFQKTGFLYSGSPARTRTTDMLVNSQPLYRLSYWGTYLMFKDFSPHSPDNHKQTQANEEIFQRLHNTSLSVCQQLQ